MAEQIQRYEFLVGGPNHQAHRPDARGRYVLFTDHEQVLAVERERSALAALSGEGRFASAATTGPVSDRDGVASENGEDKPVLAGIRAGEAVARLEVDRFYHDAQGMRPIVPPAHDPCFLPQFVSALDYLELLERFEAATDAIPGAVSAPNPTDSVARDEVTVNRADLEAVIEASLMFDMRLNAASPRLNRLRAALSEGEESK